MGAVLELLYTKVPERETAKSMGLPLSEEKQSQVSLLKSKCRVMIVPLFLQSGNRDASQSSQLLETGMRLTEGDSSVFAELQDASLAIEKGKELWRSIDELKTKQEALETCLVKELASLCDEGSNFMPLIRKIKGFKGRCTKEREDAFMHFNCMCKMELSSMSSLYEAQVDLRVGNFEKAKLKLCSDMAMCNRLPRYFCRQRHGCLAKIHFSRGDTDLARCHAMEAIKILEQGNFRRDRLPGQLEEIQVLIAADWKISSKL